MKFTEATRNYRFLVLYTLGFACAFAAAIWQGSTFLTIAFGGITIALLMSALREHKRVKREAHERLFRRPPSEEYLNNLAIAATWGGPILHESIEREPGYLTAAENTKWAHLSNQLSQAMNGDSI